ncbi:DUF4126 domain-containing protein [Formosa sp. S-31]|uniref:DUF4126 domain-containing protein n=1 Tax=Formosa sp. S-31 TaxID=2790949 RepID=UPI003EB80B05
MTFESVISVCLGVGLAAAVGFRVFIPLLALSLASYFNLLELNTSWQWLGQTSAMIVFSVATIMEILGYLIPYLDNLLDTIAIPLAGIAGTIVMASTIGDFSPVISWALAIIAGGGTAAAIAGSASSARLTSTTVTAGVGNSVVSIVETLTSILLAAFSIFLPVLAVVLVALLIFLIFKFYKKFKSNRT